MQNGMLRSFKMLWSNFWTPSMTRMYSLYSDRIYDLCSNYAAVTAICVVLNLVLSRHSARWLIVSSLMD